MFPTTGVDAEPNNTGKWNAKIDWEEYPWYDETHSCVSHIDRRHRRRCRPCHKLKKATRSETAIG